MRPHWVDQKSRKDSDGNRWHFCIWYAMSPEKAERVFFWDDEKENCGVVFFTGATHFSKLKRLIEKLTADPALREKHRKALRFPLQRYYADYGVFPEEK
jgi:hypothetical protein